MINPFDYLHYKLYNAWSIFGDGKYVEPHHGIVSLLLTFNAYTIYLGIFKGEDSNAIFMMFLVLIATGVFYRYRPKFEDQVIARFKKESEASRIIGNIAVIAYVILSIYGFGFVLKHN